MITTKNWANILSVLFLALTLWEIFHYFCFVYLQGKVTMIFMNEYIFIVLITSTWSHICIFKILFILHTYILIVTYSCYTALETRTPCIKKLKSSTHINWKLPDQDVRKVRQIWIFKMWKYCVIFMKQI